MKKFIALHIVFVASLSLAGCVPRVGEWPTVPQISGQVLDAQTRKPVENAEVVVEGHKKSKTHSDAEGRFLTRPDRRWSLGYVCFLPPCPDVLPICDITPIPWLWKNYEGRGNLLLQHDNYFSKNVSWPEIGRYHSFHSPQLDLKDPILLTPQKPQPRKTAAP